MKHDRIGETEEQAPRPASYIAELRRPAPVAAMRGTGGVIAFPAAAPVASVATCELLAETAVTYAGAEAADRAERAANDALKMAPSLLATEDEPGRLAVANAMVLTGDAFVLLSDMERAAEAFEIAVTAFDALGDLGGAARARFGLSTVLRDLRDPRARAVLEDAGELFEEAGDQTTVLVIDRLLREMRTDFEETPRSFHSSHRMFRVHPTRT